jgi:hypothetical protein
MSQKLTMLHHSLVVPLIIMGALLICPVFAQERPVPGSQECPPGKHKDSDGRCVDDDHPIVRPPDACPPGTRAATVVTCACRGGLRPLNDVIGCSPCTEVPGSKRTTCK